MTILIRKVSEPFGWLGNMSPFAVQWEGREWRSTEAVFQAMRFDDPQVRIDIWREKSPMGAKMVAKRHADKMIVQPRSEQDVVNMRLVLDEKLKQHPQLVEMLKETGDQEIIEDCSNRRNDSGLFWGAANVDGVWVGRNVLGVLWMEKRASLVS